MLGPGGFEKVSTFRREAESLGITFIVVEGPLEIADGLFITGPVARQNEHYNGPSGLFVKIDGSLAPDIIRDDQSLGMLTEKGWVMMSGCGHAGMINTAQKFQEIKNKDVFIPIVNVRNNLDGFFDRNTYYNLINYALEQNYIDQNLLYLPSLNIKHTIGKIA